MEKQIIKGIELADKELEVQEDGSLIIIKKKKCKFIPQDGQGFYFLDMVGRVKALIFSEIDEGLIWLIKHHVVFETGKECKEYKRYLELLDEYTFEPDWDNENMRKWYIYYVHNNEEIDCDCLWNSQSQECYFASEDRTREFVEKAGESNVKKFMFDIWD